MRQPASASAATSTTGTTRATCGRSSPPTSPRSTAAICAAPDRVSPTPAASCSTDGRRSSAAVAGIDDAVGLAREAADAIGDERRTQTVTRRHLDEALAALAPGDVVVTRAAWAARLTALAPDARTLADVAATLTAERGEGADTELVSWVEAACRTVESHLRDQVLQDADEENPAAVALARRLQAIADRSQQLFGAMDFGFLFDPTRKLLSIGYPRRRRDARPELLRPARLRGAARELRRDRQGRRPGAALVPARPRADARRAAARR